MSRNDLGREGMGEAALLFQPYNNSRKRIQDILKGRTKRNLPKGNVG